MGLFDKITKLAEKAADAVVKTSDQIAQTYQKDGFDGIVNKTADSLTKAGQKTQEYFTNIGDKNKQILDAIPEKDLEATLAKATAVVINTTQTIVKDAAKVTMDTVDAVSKNIDKIVAEQSEENISETSSKSQKKTSDVKDLFLNEAQIAELDCMPIELYVKHLGAQSNFDGQEDKYKLDDFVFVSKNQKWYDFSNNKGGVGSISFVSHYIRVKNGLLDNDNSEVSKEIRNSVFDILSKIAELSEYQNDLNSWIKTENDKIKSTKPVVEETPVPVAEKPKRVRKTPVAKVDETPSIARICKNPEDQPTPVAEKPKRVRKTLVAKVDETPSIARICKNPEDQPTPVVEKPKRVRKTSVAKVDETSEVPTTKSKKKIKP